MKLLLIAALTYGTFAALGTCGDASATNSEPAGTLCASSSGKYYGTLKASGDITGLCKNTASTPVATKCLASVAAHQTICCKVAQTCAAGVAAASTATVAFFCAAGNTYQTPKAYAVATGSNYCAADACVIPTDDDACCKACVAQTNCGTSGAVCAAANTGGVTKLTCTAVTQAGWYLKIVTANHATNGIPTACAAQANCGTSNAALCAAANTGGVTKQVCTAVTAAGWYLKIVTANSATNGIPTACTCATNASSCTCSGADGTTDNLITGCDAKFIYGKAKAIVPAVTRVCTTEATCALATPTGTCKAGVTEVAAIVATCTACAGDQTGCATSAAAGTVCAWPSSANNFDKTKNQLVCTKASDNYALSSSGITSACAGAGAKTFKAQATAGTDAACEITACNDGWTKGGTGTATACTINSCKAAAVPAAYTATGWPVVAAADATTKTAADAKACPAVAEVAATLAARATALLPAAAVKVAEYGTIGCKSPNVGTAKVVCAETGAAKPFKWSGCAPKASAATAQTMIGFVLTIIAMYL